MRRVVIYGSESQIKKVQNLLGKYQNEITKRNIVINYDVSNDFRAELYGYDGELKKTARKPSDIISFFEIIDKMPMGKQEKAARESFSNRIDLLNKCGLPNSSSTGHCFNDSTHHTCCMLGPKARKYADNSGNPIGTASEKAFEQRYGKKPGNGMTSWCTCLGSKVCSYYAGRFNDGTHIKFISNLNTFNEDEAIKQMKIARHGTPGVG